MKFIFIFLLLFSQTVFAQNCETVDVSGGQENKWVKVDSCWKFNVGDDPDWASLAFDDAAWQSINIFRDLDHLRKDAAKDGIVWLRLRLTVSNSFNRQMIMRIYQTGASEIYLNGKLIHQFGRVSSNPDSVIFYNPGARSISLPLAFNSENVLAIRWANKKYFYPIFYQGNKSFINVWISNSEYAANDSMVTNARLFTNRIHIAFGVLGILGILYLAFYLFFPEQRVNLYYSIGCFVFTIANLALFISFNTTDRIFWYDVVSLALSIVYILLNLFCLYLMFNNKIGLQFWVLALLGIITIPVCILVSDLVFYVFVCVAVTETIRISIKELKNKNKGAWIILLGFALSLIFWTLVLLASLSIVQLPTLYTYIPLAFVIIPVSQAVYLGFTFGTTSQALRHKLVEVQELSDENQQILADQNVLLEGQVNDRTSELKQSLEDLRSAQSQLIQAEKMASLGELTAGIAHEIQNPLNFVNNFSEVNTELISELVEEVEKGNTEQVKFIAADIKENSEKINHHGKRADAIVKGMLLHSRSSTGQKEPTDINALCDEYLRLAYHGLRAKDKSFNATIETDYDQHIGDIDIIPQDIGRVILNLINNAFYAAMLNLPSEVRGVKHIPTVWLSTKKLDGKVLISVRDNGPGIPKNILDKIFQPFFTTKPTGQGTGLGLSLSYDIVKAHNGQLEVETQEGIGSKFILKLPIIS